MVVGYTQFCRLGNDAGAKALAKSKGWLVRMWLWVLLWYFWIWTRVETRIWPDRITDLQNSRDLGRSSAKDEMKYWDSHPERLVRWHVQSLVVSPVYQRKGVGRLLMQPVIDRAQRERVPIGLTSSPEGEKLYRKLGFEKLGDFSMRIAGDDEGGGYMVLWPEGWEGAKGEE